MFVWVSVHVYGDQSLLSCLVSVASLPWGFCLHFPALGLQITTIPSSLYMDSGALNSGLHACMAITSSTKTTDDFNISIYCYIVQKAKKIFSMKKLLFNLLLQSSSRVLLSRSRVNCLSFNCYLQLSYSVKLFNRFQVPSLTILLWSCHFIIKDKDTP